jgi:acyl-CoA thioesterase FadM
MNSQLKILHGCYQEMFLLISRIINQIALGTIKPLPSKSPYLVNFICWPIDIDMFLHMNNSSYLRVAELARWRYLYSSKFLSDPQLNRLLFLVVEQKCVYKKPIMPFQRFTVSTTITSSEDKWLNYTQKFLQHPSSVKPGKDPIEYAVVEVTAVVKEKSGKTFRPSQIIERSPWAKAVFNAMNTTKS